MDAYDIFKKLTKGLKFKQRVLGVKNNAQPTTLSIKKDEEIKKEEPSDDEEPQNDSEHSEGPHSDSENQSDGQVDSQSEGHEADDLQLIKGVKVGGKKKKKKKEKTEDLKMKLELQEQNRFRNEHGIKAVGRHIPAAIQEFPDLVARYQVSPALVDTLTQCGYSEPTPVQRQALPCMLEDRQILACAPTGSGKTAAFLLPILHSLGAPQGGPRALVLCPTRELAHQIYREALRLSASTELRCSVVRNIKESKVKEREATIRKSDIIISTPNRLCYLLNQDTVNITLDKVRWLIIDEADKLFEGSAEQLSDFRQQLEQVLAACGGKQRRVAMFSATHTPPLAKWCRRHLRGVINVTVGQRNAATNLVDQELLYCGNENGKLVAFRQLVQKGLRPPVLVFVQSKERAKQLFKELIYDGINVDAIHSDRTQAQRDNVVRSFRVGRIWVLVCTELMGRGIDFRGVNLVLNYDFPPSAISYIHRVGRAGRAGQRGKAITFFTQDDVVNLRSIASVMKQSGCEVPAYMLQLKQNANKRKKRLTKAPHRDDITTILTRPDKRKLGETEADTPTQNKAEGTESVKTGKNNKLRKIQNGDVKNQNDSANSSAKKKSMFKPQGGGKRLKQNGTGKQDGGRKGAASLSTKNNPKKKNKNMTKRQNGDNKNGVNVGAKKKKKKNKNK